MPVVPKCLDTSTICSVNPLAILIPKSHTFLGRRSLEMFFPRWSCSSILLWMEWSARLCDWGRSRPPRNISWLGQFGTFTTHYIASLPFLSLDPRRSALGFFLNVQEIDESSSELLMNKVNAGYISEARWGAFLDHSPPLHHQRHQVNKKSCTFICTFTFF